ncbi:MAG: FMN-binding negative transcriptional regulator [Rhodospirillaceae bacterium]|jgi:transcriptional regulator|nr:FMN-binding negative transcriptional regulator [Rhodospirillaceae bacterium]MBT5665484.1 FMN-binding negative transcriptional regulator [Rhodospirillaceae bacterium]MBT5811606.1 FMN-binding negative transcriptional regulator [Rhodospirillaceae bacterium]
MYLPPAFEIEDRDSLYAIIRENNFGILTNQVEGAPFATHLPFMVEGDCLVAHMARANPQWRAFGDGAPALCVFQGPHAYISPSWYDSKDMVPTWNYVAVHVRGTPRIIDDPAAAYATQQRLVAAQELNLPEPWRLENEDRARIDGLLRSIVVFEIPIDQIHGKAKMNQNRTLADRRGAIAGLRETGAAGNAAVAEYMARQDAEKDIT